MYLYAQQVRHIKGSETHEAIVDVQSLSDHAELRALTKTDQLSRRRGPASMLRLEYLRKGQSGMKEGSWYNIPTEEFRDFSYRERASSESGSTYLRADLTSPTRPLDMRSYLVPPRYAPLVAANPTFGPLRLRASQMQIEVVDCGHGNWNEVLFGTVRLIYDVGACRSYDSAEVRKLVKSRRIAQDQRRIYIVISHWDVDHYQALLRFTKSDLQKVKYIYVPSQVPDTATYRSVKAKLDAAGVPIRAIPPATPAANEKAINLKQVAQKGPIRVFRATPGRSRNQTGIALGIVGPSRVALLSGDHHYEKLLAISRQRLAERKPLLLVTPHHGGHAGQPTSANWLKEFPAIESPISCGANSWGHPYGYVLTELTAMQAGVAPRRTAVNGSMIFSI